MAETLVLLHGFAGTHRGWDEVVARLGGQRYRPLALDLRGHGSARDRRPISFAACVRDVLDAAPERFALAGYSLGGRIALQVALAAPRRVSGLTLISATAGLDDPAARQARRAADAALAQELVEVGLDAFADAWTTGPLFADDPPAVQEAAAQDMLRNDAGALADALRAIGTGQMPSLWARLQELRMAVTVMAGARDPKFVGLAQRLVDGLPDARLIVVPGAGHALPRESAGAVASALEAQETHLGDVSAP